jgi:anaphase-promoting complex subunit 1
MVEVCLRELARPPGPELEHAADRESYSLTAGLALGLITIGLGEQLTAGVLADLNLADLLHSLMVGGPRSATAAALARPSFGGVRGEPRPPSYQIKEGDTINIDVTSPGATLALGMLYWGSGNRRIADWMAAPETIFLLDFVRPDFLMLRTVARGLILWHSVMPSIDWVESHVPAGMRAHCLVRPPDVPVAGVGRLDYETLNQAYCNIVAGAAFVLGLRFAGTWNRAAVETLDTLTKKFIAVSKRSIADLTGKAVIEQAICVLVLAQAMVMAGSGDLGVLRTCRYLRSRVHNTTLITYGSHMAVHMAVGLLFLGGGRLGLTNSSPTALAALIIAFYPKFPTHSNDNRYHLQALRHLYVLATEPRLILPRSITAEHRAAAAAATAAVNLSLQYRDTPWYRGPRVRLTAPSLLPALDLLAAVEVDDRACWPARFTAAAEASWTDLRHLLQEGGGLLYVKERSGLPLVKGFAWTLRHVWGISALNLFVYLPVLYRYRYRNSFDTGSQFFVVFLF